MVVAWTIILKDWDQKRNNGFAKIYSSSQVTIHYTEKHLKNSHDVPGVKVWGMYGQFEINSKFQPNSINKFFVLIKPKIKWNHPCPSLYC